MPTYEYVCSDCQTRFEVRRSIKQIDDPTTCPNCQSARVTRQISRVLAFSHSSDGSVSALGSGGCASCTSTSCSTCASRN
jgi:putative FmdB family regulatory protein